MQKKLVTKLDDIKEWEVSKGETYKRTQLKTKILISKEISGSTDLQFGIAELDSGKVHGLHAHPNVNELYYTLSGSAKITLGEDEFIATPNMAIYIPKKMKHKIANDSKKPFVFLWTMACEEIPLEDY